MAVDNVNVDEFKLNGDNSNPELGVLGALGGTEDALGTSELQSRKIEDAIMKDEVSNVNIDRLDELEECSSCLIDFSESRQAVVQSWLGALKNLIIASERGEMSEAWVKENENRKRRGQAEVRADMAMYIKTKSGMVLAGYADALQVYRILRDMVKASFSGAVKVYTGKGDKAMFSEWKASDISGVRLRL